MLSVLPGDSQGFCIKCFKSGENKSSRTSSLDSAILVGKALLGKSLVGKYLDEFGWDWTNPEPEAGNILGAHSGCAVHGLLTSL